MRHDRIYGRSTNLADWPEVVPDEPESDGFDAREVDHDHDERQDELTREDELLDIAALRDALRWSPDEYTRERIREALAERGMIA